MGEPNEADQIWPVARYSLDVGRAEEVPLTNIISRAVGFMLYPSVHTHYWQGKD